MLLKKILEICKKLGIDENSEYVNQLKTIVHQHPIQFPPDKGFQRPPPDILINAGSPNLTEFINSNDLIFENYNMYELLDYLNPQ